MRAENSRASGASRRLKVVGALLVLTCLATPAVVHADSGGATISTLPESEALQGSVEVQHDCSGETFCAWYGEASAYSAGVECPSTFDSSHGVWVGGGGVKTESGTDSGTFAFSPFGLPDEVKLCLYVSASGDSLVGESHPFSRSAGREILPQPPGPPPRYPSHMSVWVHIIRRCNFVLHIAVNHQHAVGGNIAVSLYKVERHHRLRRIFAETGAAEDHFTEGEGYQAGTYRFTGRFLGDDNLLPSNAASTAFHLRHC